MPFFVSNVLIKDKSFENIDCFIYLDCLISTTKGFSKINHKGTSCLKYWISFLNPAFINLDINH